jgi:hypothetical protein
MATQDASDAGANFMLDALGSGGNIWVGLSSTAPTKAGGNINEPPSGYARSQVAFSAATARKRTNTSVANFVPGGGAAVGSLGPFTHATFHSAVTGGTFYCSTQLSQTLNWTAGLPVTMAIGDVSLEFEAV